MLNLLEKVHKMEKDEQPLTTGFVLKWGTFALAFLSGLISFVWYVASINTKLATHDLILVDLKSSIQQVDSNSLTRHNAQEKEIDSLNLRLNGIEKTQSEANAKLDVSIAILTRLEKIVQENNGKLKVN